VGLTRNPHETADRKHDLKSKEAKKSGQADLRRATTPKKKRLKMENHNSRINEEQIINFGGII